MSSIDPLETGEAFRSLFILYIDGKEFEILRLAPVTRGALKAYVHIRWGDFIINDCRIIQEPGKRAWLSLPVATTRDEFGTVRYHSIIEIKNDKLKKQISDVVIAAWEKLLEEAKPNGEERE